MVRNRPGRPGFRRSGAPAAHLPAARRDAGNSEPGPAGNWLWGTHAVAAALANPRRRIHQLLATENALLRLPAGLRQAQLVTGADLDNRLPPGAVHQGAALKADPLEPAALEDLIAEGATRIAVLDQVSDPHNLGAIFRSAAAFGFAGLVLQSRNAPPVTGVVAKSAAGAIETVAEVRVVNIARTLEQLGEAGFHTVGLDGASQRLLDRAVRGAGKVAIVLGAEGAGLRPGVAKACAERARIAIAPDIESLNVSNAAAIAFYETARADLPVT